ncbi:MAG TPA: O-antigen ligase family protein [Bryobacteraceae bacterium]|nr:O-antigen ligase family protein [Bryobacteraceae bacterium]
MASNALPDLWLASERRWQANDRRAAVLLGSWAAAIAIAPNPKWKLLLAAPGVLAAIAAWTLARPPRWIGGFLGAALLLPPLPFALGDTGPHPCLLFAGLGVLAGAVWLAEWRIPGTSLNAALASLAGAILASIAPAAIYSGATLAALSLARAGLLVIAIYVFLFAAYGPGRPADSFRAIRWLFCAAVIAALFACVDFYYQFPAPAGYGPQFVWLDSGVYRRAQGLFYEASTLGNFCAFFLAMIAVCLARGGAAIPVARKWLVAGAVVLFAALVLSYSRASLLNVAVACAAMLWRYRRNLGARKLAALAAIGITVAAVTWKIFPVFADTYWLRLSASAQYLFSATEAVFSGRMASWQTLMAWIRENPWHLLWGIGYKTLPYTDYLGAPLVADNMYLSLLVETGIAGLAALVWVHIAILRAAARASRAADQGRSFCGTWIFCFWCGQIVQMLSGDLLTYWRVLPIYFFVLALAVRA